MSAIRRPRSILWKELREQWPVGPLLLALQAIHAAAGVESGLPAEWVIGLWTVGMLFAALIYGSLLFAAESNRESWEFLRQLPISRAKLLGSKLAAGGLQTGCLLMLSALLFAVLTKFGVPLPTSVTGWASLLLALALAFFCGAVGSLVWRQAIRAFFGGGVALCLAATAVYQVTDLSLARVVISMGPLSRVPPIDQGSTFIAATFGIVAMASYALFSLFWRLESPRATAVRRRLPEARVSRALQLLRLAIDGKGTRGFLRPLFGGEWRRKRFLVTVLLIVPWVVSYVPGWDMSLVEPLPVGPFELWAALAGTLLGVYLFTRPERDSTSFFLHHLPIPRLRLVAMRLLFGLVLGALLVAELGLVAGRVTPLYPELLLRFALAFSICFGLGTMLSPSPASSTTKVLLVAATASSLEFAVSAAPELLQWSLPLTWTFVLIAVWVSAIRTVAQRDAFEPGSTVHLRALWLVLPSWLWFGWTAGWFGWTAGWSGH